MATLTSAGITFGSGNALNDLPWYTGTDSANTSYPVGQYLLSTGGSTGTTAQMNQSRTIYRFNASPFFLTLSASNAAALAGTWRFRGSGSYDGCFGFGTTLMYQRTA